MPVAEGQSACGELHCRWTLTLDPAPILHRFFSGFTPQRRPLLLLDYDGTLAPFRVDRFQAVPWPGVRELLQLIQDQRATRIAVVTGRPAAEIGPLLGLREPVETWGLHGFERLHPEGRHEREHLPDAVQRKLEALREQLNRDSFGGLFEAKPNAVVVHWRGVPAAEAAAIERHTRTLFEPLAQGQGFRLLPFEAGLELRAGRDKSAAVEGLLADCADCGPVAYLGDDLTDEAAFRALQGRGLGVLVRPELRETAADLWLKPPQELLEFLERWLGAVGSLTRDL